MGDVVVMVREVLQAHITDSITIYIVRLHLVANAIHSLVRDVEETIIDLNLWKSVKPHVLTKSTIPKEMMV